MPKIYYVVDCNTKVAFPFSKFIDMKKKEATLSNFFSGSCTLLKPGKISFGYRFQGEIFSFSILSTSQEVEMYKNLAKGEVVELEVEDLSTSEDFN